jgi:CoA-transferase family III
MTDQPPLNDVRVLEYTRGPAGRTVGGLLADLGAEVVQLPAHGSAPGPEDPARVWSDRRKVVRGVGALDSVGRLDLLVREDVAGEFANLLVPGVREAVNAELETTFAALSPCRAMSPGRAGRFRSG